MRDGYPYHRFLKFKMSWTENLHFWFLRASGRLKKIGHKFYLDHLGGAKIEERKHYPFARYDENLATPLRPLSPIGARTRHGEAILSWNWTRRWEKTTRGEINWIDTASPRNAENALLPDGARGRVYKAMCGWRRPVTGSRIWL